MSVSIKDKGASESQRHILVIYVGGTIGMMPNGLNALAPVAGYLTKEMRQMRELVNSDGDSHQGTGVSYTFNQDLRVPTFDILEYEKLLDSSDMDQHDWLQIARDVERYYYQYDGFLIAHGTDTMHFTAAALSFLLQNLSKPVILTGAMVPLAEPYNDARRNVVVGMMFAASPDICEVCIYSNDVLLRGNRSIKLRHTMSAFSSPNYAPLAVMEGHGFSVRRHLLLPPPSGPLTINSDMSGRVMTVLCHPDFDVDSLKTMMKKADSNTPQCVLDCMVLELMGVGTANSEMARTLGELVDVVSRAGCLVVFTTQDLFGSLTENGVRKLRQRCPGAVFISDMTTETAAVKAMYLFGKKLSVDRVRQLMPRNLRGEVGLLSSKL